MIDIPQAGQTVQPQPGITAWRNAINGFVVVRTHYTAMPQKRGNWRYMASPKYGGLRSWRWRKEQEIDFEAQQGQVVFEQWDPAAHVIQSFEIPDHWPRWILFDPGWRNPSAIEWVAVDVDSEPNEYGFRPIHIYREFYEPKHSAAACAIVCSEYSMVGRAETLTVEREWIECILVDPMAKQEHQGAASGDKVGEAAENTLGKFMEKIEDLGWDVPVETGNNHKQEAIEELVARLGCYWIGQDGLPLYDAGDRFREPDLAEIAEGALKIFPTLFFHNSVVEGAREMGKYRWRHWASGEVAERHNNPESPVDKDDHCITNLIRFTNLLRSARTENGTDLSEFDARQQPKAWQPEEEIIQERHRTLAGRYRRQLRARRSD